MSGVEEINGILEKEAPILFRALSPLGREVFFPPDIPFQANEAKGTSLNGTIGVFTDGAGNALPLHTMAEIFDLDQGDLNNAFLYSPMLGLPELRSAWRTWQRTDQSDEAPAPGLASSLPMVTHGLTHGLGLCADLFGGPGTVLALTTPFWGNYRQIFAMRTGMAVKTAPAYQNRVFDPLAIAGILAGLPAGETAMVLLNFPSNPGGYSPTAAEFEQLRKSLVEAAASRPLVVVCDDAYGGLVFAPGVPNRSLFWSLIGQHPNLIPIKIDGATKEFAFFGGRVGFLTFGLELTPTAAKAIENKVSGLVRATLGSPTALSQVVLLQALRSGQAIAEVEEVRAIAAERYEAVKPALAELDPELLLPLPFNSGFFVMLELNPALGLEPHEVRRHLIANHDTGIVASPPNYLRLAICSVAAEDLPEMVRRIERGVRELAGKSVGV
jgi:aspartate/methionine/tyrosine aminotransferase